ncbi:MAG: DinB family protein [Flavobacteriales bacterium]|nr:DinB family protein [Flavobacteriales bacterium]
MARPRLRRAIERAEGERERLLKVLDPLPHDLLERSPTAMVWSVAQVIAHLATIEEGALAYLTKKLHYGKHRPVSPSAGIRLLILNAGLRLPVKYKAPAVVAAVPPTSYADARARWCMAREGLIAAYSALPDELLLHGLFKHPALGRFDPARALRFLRRHMLRHVGQIQRTLRSAGSSAE